MNRIATTALLAFCTACSREASPPVDHSAHQAQQPGSDPHAGHDMQMPSTGPEGYSAVMLDKDQAAAMGLTTVPVEERDFSRKIRTVGLVTVDETRTAHVHSRVRGWIEGFHVQFVGQTVKKGEPLISIYSQEVYAAELELASLMKSPMKSPELLDAARKRLALWEVPKATVDQVE